ncbi:DNA recombination protein RmuC [Porphyromonas sp.]|uniref:DNA recombination protein RmuC n=1 Tax=Porphyromonas sp. TaxID=1924944 RepID=UPI001CB2304A|nr:DNA recombination protein RmuC [Porphyromonas sp.]MBF1395394.1 DNA recombination protein RmuC [Porphyromonas sp.]
MIYFLGAFCLVFLVLFLYSGKRIKELTDVAAAAERAEHEKALELKTLETKLQTTAEAHQELRQRYDALQQKADEAAVSLAAVKTERASLAAELEKLQAEKGKLAEELRDSFRAVANDIMRERTEDLDKRTKETLSPLREDLKRFGEQVDKTYQEEARERFNLKDSIEKLILRSQEISQETTSLTRALRGDSKVQGDWGELVLERILDQSGLIRGEHYFVQETLRDESGAVITTGDNRGGLRPDVIVRYPNRGAIVIDSKVSLTAYARYVAAETDAERDQALKEHLLSLRKHINELSGKRYEEYTEGSPNFVMLFIPNEPAYTIALAHDPTLWEEAYRKNVVLINGTNLIAALRMAQDMWQRDSQQRNVLQIVDEAGKLYDKFATFSETFLKIESKLEDAQKAFGEAKGQLRDGRGDILGRFDKLKALGAKTKKALPGGIQPPASASEDE